MGAQSEGATGDTETSAGGTRGTAATSNTRGTATMGNSRGTNANGVVSGSSDVSENGAAGDDRIGDQSMSNISDAEDQAPSMLIWLIPAIAVCVCLVLVLGALAMRKRRARDQNSDTAMSDSPSLASVEDTDAFGAPTRSNIYGSAPSVGLPQSGQYGSAPPLETSGGTYNGAAMAQPFYESLPADQSRQYDSLRDAQMRGEEGVHSRQYDSLRDAQMRTPPSAPAYDSVPDGAMKDQQPVMYESSIQPM